MKNGELRWSMQEKKERGMEHDLLERIRKYNKIIKERLEKKVDRCVEKSLQKQEDRMTNHDKGK